MAEEIINSNRQTGKPAQINNILAAKTLANIVKTTLGPKGMDKMLVDSQGRITVTNDGVTILEELQINHPAAKLIVEIAKNQEKEIGDGTTTVTMLAGMLLEEAEKLIEKGIHPTLIAKGYLIAERKAQEIVKTLAIKAETDEILKKIAQTAMTGKGAEGFREELSELIVSAVKTAKKENIIFAGIPGKSIRESRLIKGIVLEKEIPHDKMPKSLTNAIIGLCDFDLDLKNPEIDTTINFSNFADVNNFQNAENEKLKEYAKKIIDSGANVIFCNKNINDKILYELAKLGIVAIRRVNKFELEILAKTTGANVVSNMDDFNKENFGKAGKVYEETYSHDEKRLFVEDCEKATAVTILVHATTEHNMREITRAMTDGLGDVNASKDSFIVAGGGAVEIETAKQLRDYAKTFPGREQLIIEAFASALENIPETLAENAGLDSINVMTSLKQKHDKGEKNVGINLFKDILEDTMNEGIVEPLKIKTQAFSSATEVSVMILRIDDILQAQGKNGE
jgi:thermosome